MFTSSYAPQVLGGHVAVSAVRVLKLPPQRRYPYLTLSSTGINIVGSSSSSIKYRYRYEYKCFIFARPRGMLDWQVSQQVLISQSLQYGYGHSFPAGLLSSTSVLFIYKARADEGFFPKC
jgi:hypothetical protein